MWICRNLFSRAIFFNIWIRRFWNILKIKIQLLTTSGNKSFDVWGWLSTYKCSYIYFSTCVKAERWNWTPSKWIPRISHLYYSQCSHCFWIDFWIWRTMSACFPLLTHPRYFMGRSRVSSRLLLKSSHFSLRWRGLKMQSYSSWVPPGQPWWYLGVLEASETTTVGCSRFQRLPRHPLTVVWYCRCLLCDNWMYSMIIKQTTNFCWAEILRVFLS